MRTLTFFILSLLCFPLSANAARFYFEGDTSIRVGETVPVILMLDTEGAEVNALEGTVLASGVLQMVGIREQDSVVSMWIERPVIAGTGTAYFSGIIPGGFSGVLSPFWEGGRPGAVYTILVEGTGQGTGQLSLGPAASVLQNDGMGTQLPVTAADLVIRVTEGAAPAASVPEDTDMPEEFTPLVAQDSDVFGGAHFLVFSTIDTASGIDHYEVAETRTRFNEPVFARAESPYQLSDQSLRSYVHVKAVDRAGNERVTILPPQQSDPWKPYLWSILLGLVVIAVLSKILRRRHESLL